MHLVRNWTEEEDCKSARKKWRRRAANLLGRLPPPFSLFWCFLFRPGNLGLFGALLQAPAPEKKEGVTAAVTGKTRGKPDINYHLYFVNVGAAH